MPWNQDKLTVNKVFVLAHLSKQLVTLYISTLANKLMYPLHFEHFKHRKQVYKKKEKKIYTEIMDPS